MSIGGLWFPRFQAWVSNLKELLAELLLLRNKDESPPMRRTIANLFLAAGSPGRAELMYRDLIERDPDNLDAYAGLGEAALLESDFHSARRAFLTLSGAG